MERLTTNTPNNNFETMLNFVHGKDGWAHIYDEDGKEVNLITWAINHCHDRGCDDFQCETLEEYDEALGSCMADYMDCPIAMAYCFASQAVHLRSRLKMYEDTMPLERAQELAQAEKDGRLVVLPCKVGDTVWTNIAIVGDRYKAADRPYPVEVVFIGMGKDEGFFHVQYSSGRVFPFDFDKVGKTVFLTREEAEAALKKREEAKNEAADDRCPKRGL